MLNNITTIQISPRGDFIVKNEGVIIGPGAKVVGSTVTGKIIAGKIEDAFKSTVGTRDDGDDLKKALETLKEQVTQLVTGLEKKAAEDPKTAETMEEVAGNFKTLAQQAAGTEADQECASGHRTRVGQRGKDRCRDDRTRQRGR